MNKQDVKVGDKVYYHPTIGKEPKFTATVASAAWQVGSTWVVNLRDLPQAYCDYTHRNRNTVNAAAIAALSPVSKAQRVEAPVPAYGVPMNEDPAYRRYEGETSSTSYDDSSFAQAVVDVAEAVVDAFLSTDTSTPDTGDSFSGGGGDFGGGGASGEW
jgi:hypothetical protein